MADPNKPFKRVGANSWEELLEKVNEQLENPPSNTECTPIDPIEVPDECHQWAKSDIREVHDKLDETGNCFSFAPIPDTWKNSTLTDIEDQLDNAWCDCEPECEECPDAPSDLSNPFIEYTFDSKAVCIDFANISQYQPEVVGPSLVQRSEAEDAVAQARQDTFAALFDIERLGKAVDIVSEDVEELEDELEQLKAIRDAACEEPGPACDAAQEDVDEKQEELDDDKEFLQSLQDQLEIAITEWLAAREAYNQTAQELLDLFRQYTLINDTDRESVNVWNNVPVVPWPFQDLDIRTDPGRIAEQIDECVPSWGIRYASCTSNTPVSFTRVLGNFSPNGTLVPNGTSSGTGFFGIGIPFQTLRIGNQNNEGDCDEKESENAAQPIKQSTTMWVCRKTRCGEGINDNLNPCLDIGLLTPFPPC